MAKALQKAKMNFTVWTGYRVNLNTYKFEPSLDELTPPIYPKTRNFTQDWCLHFKASNIGQPKKGLQEVRRCAGASAFFVCKHSCKLLQIFLLIIFNLYLFQYLTLYLYDI